MKKLILCILLLGFLNTISAQEGNVVLPQASQKYVLTYSQLKEYQGRYEYVNNATIKIAASPKDTILYAIINESKYKLTPTDRDLFVDMTKNKIQFFRTKKNEIAGYYTGNDTLKLLNNNVKFPKEIWYPRLPNSKGYPAVARFLSRDKWNK